MSLTVTICFVPKNHGGTETLSSERGGVLRRLRYLHRECCADFLRGAAQRGWKSCERLRPRPGENPHNGWPGRDHARKVSSPCLGASCAVMAVSMGSGSQSAPTEARKASMVAEKSSQLLRAGVNWRVLCKAPTIRSRTEASSLSHSSFLARERPSAKNEPQSLAKRPEMP